MVRPRDDGHVHMWRPLVQIVGWFDGAKVVEACILCDALEWHGIVGLDLPIDLQQYDVTARERM